MSAFDNQMVWYKQLLAMHPEWTVVGEYEDGSDKIGLNQQSPYSKGAR